MKPETHTLNLKESLNEIENAVKTGLEGKQRTIGFHTSAACADLFEIYLHKIGVLPEDHMFKHEWLLSNKKIDEKLPSDFKGKKEIIPLVRAVENKRNNFCYGKKKSPEELGELISDFNKVKAKFEELGVEIL